MYAYGPGWKAMWEVQAGLPNQRLHPDGRGSAQPRGQDVVSGQSPSGCVGCTVRASGYEVLSTWEALGIIIEHDNMS